MEYLGGLNLFFHDFVIGTAIPPVTSSVKCVKTVNKWMSYKDEAPFMNRYRTERTQYIVFLNTIDLAQFKNLLIDLYIIYKKHYPYGERQDFIKHTLSYTLYDLEEFIKFDFTFYGPIPDQKDFSFYYVFSHDDREFFDFVTSSEHDIEYYRQYYKKVIQLIKSMDFEAELKAHRKPFTLSDYVHLCNHINKIRQYTSALSGDVKKQFEHQLLIKQKFEEANNLSIEHKEEPQTNEKPPKRNINEAKEIFFIKAIESILRLDLDMNVIFHFIHQVRDDLNQSLIPIDSSKKAGGKVKNGKIEYFNYSNGIINRDQLSRYTKHFNTKIKEAHNQVRSGDDLTIGIDDETEILHNASSGKGYNSSFHFQGDVNNSGKPRLNLFNVQYEPEKSEKEKTKKDGRSQEKMSFGLKRGNTDKLKNIISQLGLKLEKGFINEELSSIEIALSILLSKDILQESGSIHLKCETRQLRYIIDKIKPMFSSLTLTKIGKSKKFISSLGNPISEGNLSQNKIDSPKEKDIIDQIFKELL